MIKKLLLKSFFILWLTLLPICFSSAVDQNFYPNLPATLLDWQNNDLELKPWVNFLFNDSYKYISVYGWGPYPRLKSVFWTNDGLYFLRSCAWWYSCENINTSIEIQWYVQNVLKCSISDVDCATSPTSFNISEFISNSNYSNPDYMIVHDNQWNNTTLSLCFVYNSLDIQICVPFDWISLDDSIWFTFNPLPSQLWQSEDQISSYFTNSPFIWGSTSPLPDYSIWTWRQLRNYEVLMWFEYMWLSKEYCYWWFDLDNIFLPTEIFEDFQGYSFWIGASIFDLHNVYSWGLTMKPFLGSYYQSFLNAQLSNFHNKSKALLMLFQQYQSANDRWWGSFNLNDLWDYCDLYFYLRDNNRENDWDIYTWHNQNAEISYQLNRKIPEGGFINTWVLNNWTWFSTPDEFFWRLTSLFQSNIDWVNDTFPPIIPSYIVAFMLAIILIRIISH